MSNQTTTTIPPDAELNARIANLPGWARGTIDQQARRIAELEHLLAQYAGTESSRVSLVYPGNMERVFVPDSCRVYFDVDDRAETAPNGEDVQIKCRITNGHLYVSGDLPLRILPVSSNAVEIGLEKRR